MILYWKCAFVFLCDGLNIIEAI